jgi:hypothetical protein
MIELTQTDWRDLLLNAEYEYPEKRVRNFNNEFGKEKIKASRYYRIKLIASKSFFTKVLVDFISVIYLLYLMLKLHN